jgi:hypothetical protein
VGGAARNSSAFGVDGVLRRHRAFPSTLYRVSWFAPVLRVACSLNTPRSESRFVAQGDTAIRVDMPLYPRDPRSGPGYYVVPVHHRLLAEDKHLGFKSLAS